MSTLAAIVIVATLAGVALGEIPRLRMNRATIALLGAVLLVAIGALPLEAAYRALDLDTLVLLFAMMIVNANLRLAGFFALAGRWIVRRARSPRRLLTGVIVASGVLSALFLNDTVVLMFTPLVIEIVVALRRNPVPYLIGLAAAANVGSAATITGNPQNMIIGIASGIPYRTFTAALAPVSLAGLAVCWLVLVLLYRREFARLLFDEPPPVRFRPLWPMLYKTLAISAGLLVAFLAGVSIPLAAITAASVLLVTRRVKPERVFREIDWSLLVFFAGLFVVTGAIRELGFSARLFLWAKPMAESGVAAESAVAAVLSNLVSNVPAVLLFRPLVPSFPDPQRSWLVLAMSTTFAGNLTLLGSVANLIVAESARVRGVRLGFVEYLRAGLAITIATLAIGVAWFSYKR